MDQTAFEGQWRRGSLLQDDLEMPDKAQDDDHGLLRDSSIQFLSSVYVKTAEKEVKEAIDQPVVGVSTD